MPEGGVEVGELHLIVSSDGLIRVTARPPGFDAQDQQIGDAAKDGLLSDTIRALIQMARENRLKGHDEYQLLGSHLYAVLLDNDIGRALHRVLSDVSLKLVRVVLEFEKGDDNLASWPWEYLHCPLSPEPGSGYFLSQVTKLVLVRNLPYKGTVTLTVEEPPVRVLFVASEPAGMALSYESVLETLEDLEGAHHDAMQLRVIRPKVTGTDAELAVATATYTNFIDMAKAFEPHLIHIVAHGRRARTRSELAFMDATGEANWIPEKVLAHDLSKIELPSVRFVFLEACESALPGSSGMHGHAAAISGVAMRLAHAGVPAVVGMQYQIRQGAANVFTREFYKALLDRETVDMAVLRGRGALDRAEREISRSESDDQLAGRPGFGLPVLYLKEYSALFPPVVKHVRGPTDVPSEIGGRRSAAPPHIDRNPETPELLTACRRCGVECHPADQYCDGCGNHLKCPSCGWPVLIARESCGHCKAALRIENVALVSPYARRAAPPSAGTAGSWEAKREARLQ